MSADGIARVVGNVQPLVPVAGPGVRQLDPADEMSCTWARGRPEPEGAVDVNPGIDGVCRLDDRCHVVARAGVHVAGRGADNRRRRLVLSEHFPQCVGIHRAACEGRYLDDRALAQPEETNRAIDRRVALGGHHDPDPRCAVQALATHIPALLM